MSPGQDVMSICSLEVGFSVIWTVLGNLHCGLKDQEHGHYAAGTTTEDTAEKICFLFKQLVCFLPPARSLCHTCVRLSFCRLIPSVSGRTAFGDRLAKLRAVVGVVNLVLSTLSFWHVRQNFYIVYFCKSFTDTPSNFSLPSNFLVYMDEAWLRLLGEGLRNVLVVVEKGCGTLPIITLDMKLVLKSNSLTSASTPLHVSLALIVSIKLHVWK